MLGAAVSGGSAPAAPDAVLSSAASQPDRLTITGTLTVGGVAKVFPTLIDAGVLNEGRPQYNSTGYPGNSGAAPTELCFFGVYGGVAQWRLTPVFGSNYWKSTDDVATPNLATTWTAVGTVGGTPVVALASNAPLAPQAVLA